MTQRILKKEANDDDANKSTDEDSDWVYSPHDSEYDSEVSAEDVDIDFEEVRLLQKDNVEPRLTPPRKLH